MYIQAQAYIQIRTYTRMQIILCILHHSQYFLSLHLIYAIFRYYLAEILYELRKPASRTCWNLQNIRSVKSELDMVVWSFHVTTN